MNNKSHTNSCMHSVVAWVLVFTVLALGGCADIGPQPPPQPAPPPVQPLPAPPIVKTIDPLPPLDVLMIAHHEQCEAPAGSVAVSDDAKQLRDLMQWLKRSCAINDATLMPQLTALKKLRRHYPWPDAYAAWLDEWRRQLVRMQMLQQRAASAEAEQATMVKRLRAIERDLTTRP